MSATAKLTWIELKLGFRDWSTVVFGLFFPAVLLVILAYVFPGFRDPNPDLNGGRMVDLYAPIILVFSLVMVGVGAIAANLATYRANGVLRRLQTTPIKPARLLGAHLTAQLVVALTGAAVAIVVALTVLNVPAPANWPAALFAVALSALSVFSIGLLLGAVVPSASAAQTIGGLAWLPIMVLAGLWFPREVMPATMRTISDYSPGGAAVEAVQQAWFGSGFAPTSLVVLAIFAVVATGIGAVLFRWE